MLSSPLIGVAQEAARLSIPVGDAVGVVLVASSAFVGDAPAPDLGGDRPTDRRLEMPATTESLPDESPVGIDAIRGSRRAARMSGAASVAGAAGRRGPSRRAIRHDDRGGRHQAH